VGLPPDTEIHAQNGAVIQTAEHEVRREKLVWEITGKAAEGARVRVRESAKKSRYFLKAIHSMEVMNNSK